MADQATVSDGYSVGPSWGHDGGYDRCIGSLCDDGEGSRGVGSCCLLMGTRCGVACRMRFLVGLFANRVAGALLAL